jgi:hypothetical protein
LAFFVAGGEGELELGGGGFGVVEEELVEVAEAEEEQGVGVLAFGGQVLAHERGLSVGGGVRHGKGQDTAYGCLEFRGQSFGV